MASALTSFHPSKNHSDKERWICIYPAYINSKKTLAEGRKIAKEHCVENPTHQEIRDILASANMRVGVENKLYSRERSKEVLFRGRIRVQLKNDDGTLYNPEFPTRESLMVYIGDTIPKLKSRQGRAAPEGASSQSSSSQNTGGRKGKGKGRR